MREEKDNKSKRQVEEKTGIITELLPNTTFRVKLNDDGEILAHLSGRMRLHFIRVTQGDSVIVEMSPYDNTKGRIIKRT